jgi:hypothetical protein
LFCSPLIHIWNHTMINWTINWLHFQKDRNILWILKWYYTEQDKNKKSQAPKLPLNSNQSKLQTIQLKIIPMLTDLSLF